MYMQVSSCFLLCLIGEDRSLQLFLNQAQSVSFTTCSPVIECTMATNVDLKLHKHSYSHMQAISEFGKYVVDPCYQSKKCLVSRTLEWFEQWVVQCVVNFTATEILLENKLFNSTAQFRQEAVASFCI